MHIDLNSCFATIEQQANPFLRGKPLAVGAYTTPSGCIIAPSVEAKAFGVKTGMRVKDGKALVPQLEVLASDPPKYRIAHQRLKKLLLEYTDRVVPKSIDEFVLDFEGTPAFNRGLHKVGAEIKQRIKSEIGDWIRVNIGIAPNRFLAKTAASLHKPDGLDEINHSNVLEVFASLKLTDLCGIDKRYAVRLHRQGIYTVIDFYNASGFKLKDAFHSVIGYDWYYRLHGYEVDDIEFPRRSYGNSYALPITLSTPEQLAPLLMKLVDKTGWRMRKGGFQARGIHVAVAFRSGNSWHQGVNLPQPLLHSQEIYKEMYRLLCKCPYQEPVRVLAECCFNLAPSTNPQLQLFDDVLTKQKLVQAIDSIKEKYGNFSLIPGTMLGTDNYVPDRVSFGGIKELMEYISEDDLDDINTFTSDMYL